ncbi:hypothetical protein ACFVRD_43435 [Streptomyces sp. NPDC057908]|uniref:hypothetical protein n=1 Tax=Streptomyces sp. NPDC057908 TaxID=3346276 RepID=UPI0036F0F421
MTREAARSGCLCSGGRAVQGVEELSEGDLVFAVLEGHGSGERRPPVGAAPAVVLVRWRQKLVNRVRLTATDTDLAIGTGPKATGPALFLLLAVSGRRVVLDDLSEPGVATLAAGS